jgi:hypothetical protein
LDHRKNFRKTVLVQLSHFIKKETKANDENDILKITEVAAHSAKITAQTVSSHLS